MDDDLRLLVRKHALDNARKYNGVPNVGAVIGKVLSERPELKPKLKSLSSDIRKVCDEVKVLQVEEQVAELRQVAPELLEARGPEEKTLKPLKNAVKGSVTLRVAPSASGPLHVGHAVVFSLSHLYAKEYEGNLLLRIEDTNPENVYEPAYNMIEEDMNWLSENSVRKMVIQSDRLETYYDIAHDLIQKGRAYVCTCSADMFRNLALKKQACPCRGVETAKQLERFSGMFARYQPGEAVVRIKTDISHPNPAMRDWPALRINHNRHPRTGDRYKVWPLMNFSVAIDDHELGVTHSIRGKDHVDNEKRQQFLFDYLGWTPPLHAYVGRINFEGLELSTTRTKVEIERGEFDDWSDPRLPFLAAFRRRGFQPGAFHRFALDMGLGVNDKVVPAMDFFKSLEAHNRDLVDPVASRYFFVWAPEKIEVKDAPEQNIAVPLHPDDKERGVREFRTAKEFYVSKDDLAKVQKDGVYRLKDCLNFRMGDDGALVFDSQELDRKKSKATMHWLPARGNMKVEVVMPNNTLLKGLGESALKEVEEGAVVQFERFGFCRLDKRGENKLVFYFAHK